MGHVVKASLIARPAPVRITLDRVARGKSPNQLQIESRLETVEDDLDTAESDIDTLGSGLAAEVLARTNADTALDARLDAIEDGVGEFSVTADGFTSSLTLAEWVNQPLPVAIEQASAAGNVTELGAKVAVGDFVLQPNLYDIDDAVTMDQQARSIVGPTPVRASFGVDGTQAHLRQTDGDALIFNVTSSNFVLAHVELSNNGTRSTNLIKAQRANLSADVDMRLEDVILNGDADTTEALIYINGRGLAVTDAIFALGSAAAVEIDWQTTGSDAINETFSSENWDKGAEGGFRGFHFSHWRVHGHGIKGVTNTGPNKHNLLGLLMNDILVDIGGGGQVFVGVLNMSMLATHVVNSAPSTPYVLQGGTSTRPAVGAVVGPISVNGNRDESTRRPERMVLLEEGYYNGLYLFGAGSFIELAAVEIQGDDPSTTIIENLVIDLSVAELGTQPGASYLLKASDCTIKNMILRGSVGKHANNTADGLVLLSNVIISGCRSELAFDASDFSSVIDPSSDFTDNGGNDFNGELAEGKVRVLAKSGVRSSHTGDTNETTLATIPLPGGMLGPNGYLEFDVQWFATDNANNKTLKVKLGGTTLWSVTFASQEQLRINRLLFNRNAENSQVMFALGSINSFAQSPASVSTFAIDTSEDQDLTITAQLADGGDTVAVDCYAVRVCYGR